MYLSDNLTSHTEMVKERNIKGTVLEEYQGSVSQNSPGMPSGSLNFFCMVQKP